MSEQTQKHLSISANIKPNTEQYAEDGFYFGDLPFTKYVGKKKNRRLKYWHVKPTGEPRADSAIGAIYATEFMQFVYMNPQRRSLWIA